MRMQTRFWGLCLCFCLGFGKLEAEQVPSIYKQFRMPANFWLYPEAVPVNLLFTEEIFRLAGLSTRVKHITTEEYPTPAKRPAYSVLDNYMLRLTTDYKFAEWKDALKEYMDNRK